MEQDESDVLAKAAQLSALEKRIGLKLDMAEHFESDEYDGEEIDEANTLALAYAGRISNALLAKHSALEAARARITELEALVADAREENERLKAALRPFAKIEVPRTAEAGTWVARTLHCNDQVTAHSVWNAREALGRHKDSQHEL